MHSYKFRKSVLLGETIYKLDGGYLKVEQLPKNGGTPTHDAEIPLSDIQQIKLRYDPTRMQANRYRTTVVVEGQPNRDLFSSSYKSFANFESRGAEYSEFVRQLVLSAAQDNPQLECIKGLGWGGMILSLLTAVFVLFMVFVGAIYSVVYGVPWVILIKLGILVVYFPIYLGYLRDNWPGKFAANEPPQSMLPTK